MKKGQRTDFKKEVFQTGLTERSTGGVALKRFISANHQAKRQRLNVVRKKKK